MPHLGLCTPSFCLSSWLHVNAANRGDSRKTGRQERGGKDLLLPVSFLPCEQCHFQFLAEAAAAFTLQFFQHFGLNLLTVLSTKHTSANWTVHPRPAPGGLCQICGVGLLVLVLGNKFNSRLELKRELVKWKKGQNEIQKRNEKRHIRYFEMFYRVALEILKMKQTRQESPRRDNGWGFSTVTKAIKSQAQVWSSLQSQTGYIYNPYADTAW